MCGLYSFSSVPRNGFNTKEVDLVISMALLTSFRGSDSTGFCGIDTDKKVIVEKAVGGPFQLFTKDRWENNIRSFLYKKGYVCFGHGRAATRGTVTLDNAHPFEVERKDGSRIILVHNGTLEYAQPFEGLRDHAVDSAWLAHLIAEKGAKEVLPRVNGALALIWYDSADDTINLFRNEQRPLSVAICKGAYYAASEDSTLAYAKSKFKLDYDYNDILTLKAMHHASIKLDDIRELKEISDFPFEKYKRVNAPVVPTYRGHTYGGGYLEEDAEVAYWRERFQAGRSVTPPLPTTITAPKKDPIMGNPNYSFVPYDVTEKCPLVTSALRAEMANRNLQNDMFRIYCKDVDRVEFTEAGRRTYFRTTSGGYFTVFHDGIKPYEKDLESIYDARDEGVIKKYIGGLEVITSNTEMERRIKERSDQLERAKWGDVTGNKDQKVLPFRLPNAVTRDDEPFLFQKMKPNRQVSFHTKTGSVTVRHKAKRTPHKDTYSFVEYENDIDGKFKLGDEVVAEVTDVDEILSKGKGTGNIKVKAVRATSKVDSCIDLVFYINNMSSEEIVEQGIFRCTIGAMRLATKAEHDSSNAAVIFLLNNPLPIYNFDSSEASHAIH